MAGVAFAMLALLKLLQSLVKTLHSEGNPAQIAAGLVLGSALGFTPLMSVQNFVIFCLLFLLNVSFGAGMLGWALATPIGFLLDPLFDTVGRSLLESPALRSFWTTLAGIPVVPLTNFDNSVTLGSTVIWLVLLVPMYFGLRFLVIHYRATLGEKVRRSRFYKALEASQVYNFYRWFRPE
jgi:uncharacterized protein (TIGR03546 family)